MLTHTRSSRHHHTPLRSDLHGGSTGSRGCGSAGRAPRLRKGILPCATRSNTCHRYFLPTHTHTYIPTATMSQQKKTVWFGGLFAPAPDPRLDRASSEPPPTLPPFNGEVEQPVAGSSRDDTIDELRRPTLDPVPEDEADDDSASSTSSTGSTSSRAARRRARREARRARRQRERRRLGLKDRVFLACSQFADACAMCFTGRVEVRGSVRNTQPRRPH